MQGKKIQQERLFINFQLSDYVPADNFYRQLNQVLDLRFLYQSTACYYGAEGQKSIDPVVFMKLMLVGYLENLNSDRRIISNSRMRMDILFFLGYDLDEELPWHSTLSRTRKLYGEEQFVALFKQVLKLCVDQGLISGKRQAVDSALIKANASIQNMVEQQVMDDASAYSKELDENIEEGIISDSKARTGNKGYLGNESTHTNQRHYSPSDPDARITKKPGKPINLYYRSQMSVDTASHFITYIQAFPGNAADNVSLPEMLKSIVGNMQEYDIKVNEVLADTGYSSGEAIRALIDHDIEGYIPSMGAYKYSKEDDGFTYDAENDHYTCKNGSKLTFRGTYNNHGKTTVQRKIYETNISDCKCCPFKDSCTDAKGRKKITHSVDKPLYDLMHQRMSSLKAKEMKKLRSSTVEPVFGSLINYTGMSRVNAKGLKQANKCMLMAAVAYNLKKLLKYKAGLLPKEPKNPLNSINDVIDTCVTYFKLKYFQNLAFQF